MEPDEFMRDSDVFVRLNILLTGDVADAANDVCCDSASCIPLPLLLFTSSPSMSRLAPPRCSGAADDGDLERDAPAESPPAADGDGDRREEVGLLRPPAAAAAAAAALTACSSSIARITALARRGDRGPAGDTAAVDAAAEAAPLLAASSLRVAATSCWMAPIAREGTSGDAKAEEGSGTAGTGLAEAVAAAEAAAAVAAAAGVEVEVAAVDDADCGVPRREEGSTFDAEGEVEGPGPWGTRPIYVRAAAVSAAAPARLFPGPVYGFDAAAI